ncbi:MAG: choice-of-anchor Q domain-containing protein [Verrucomicrobiota bacterium]
MHLVNCTIAQNVATGGSGSYGGNAGGTPGQAICGGVFNYNGIVSLLNTIIAGNSATNGSPDLYGAFVSTGLNLIGNNQGAAGLSINDFQDVPADLGPLQDKGGFTLTCVPLQGSLAIGYGTRAGAPSTDQRGVPRPQTQAVDIGAVQTATGSPLSLGPFTLSASGFCFTVIFDATNSYRVLGSTNLTTWVQATNLPNGGVGHVLDASATDLNRRFYGAEKQ